jgi:hypothetical protein
LSGDKFYYSSINMSRKKTNVLVIIHQGLANIQF